MNLELKTYKNYKELCVAMDWNPTGGKGKQYQIKELERYCNYYREGQKYIINELYEIPKERIKNKGNTGNYKRYEQLKINVEEYNNIGIYCIVKDNDIYIGSTIRGFRERFQEHHNGYDERMYHTWEMLYNNGEFYILYDMTGIEDEILIRQIENEYIQYFIDNSEYNVINKINGWNVVKNKSKKEYINIKIEKEHYSELIQLLQNKDLLEYAIVV